MIDRGSWIILGATSALRLAVGLWQTSPTASAGGVPNGADAFAVLCGLATGIALVRTASSIDDAAAGRRAAWMWAVLPLSWVVFATGNPLAPLHACIAWAIFALVRALQSGDAFWWMVCGALAGLGALGDWSALLLPVGLALAAAGSRAMRAQLVGRVQGAALATCVAIAMLALLWRARSGAPSYAADIALVPAWRAGPSMLERSAEFLVTEALAAGPVLAVLLAGVAIRVLRNGATPARAVLTRWVIVVILGGGLLGLATGAMASRTPIVWLAGTVVLGTSALVAERRHWWRAGLAVAFVLALATVAGRVRMSELPAVSLPRTTL
ncbi:MAG: glycosyltransferase family 39 protein [Gemmatimonadales bacterium]